MFANVSMFKQSSKTKLLTQGCVSVMISGCTDFL